MIPRLNSIKEVIKKFHTNGSRPILIQADDFEYYICKYPFHPQDFKLINEYLANRFAQIWEIDVPELAFINVKRKHVPESMLGDRLTYSNIEIPIVGFKKVDDITEYADTFAEGLSKSDLRKYNKGKYLQLALFDIWLSNDDRNINNTNILTKSGDEEVYPVAIDHEKIFNTGNLARPIYSLSYEDSLLYSNLYHRLLKNSESTINLIEDVCANLQSNVEKCQYSLKHILADVPAQWNVDLAELEKRISNNIFSTAWIKEVEATFREFTSLAIKKL